MTPIKNKYVKKHDNYEHFSEIEKFFIKLVDITKSFEFDFADNLYAEVTSAFGWLYVLNYGLDINNLETSASWLTISNEIALSNGMIEVFVNNKNLELFHIPLIMDLKKHLNNVFEYMFFIKDHINNEGVIDAFLNSSNTFINNIHKDDAPSAELRILNNIKDGLKHIKDSKSNHTENFIFLVIGFLKNRLTINYDKHKVIIFFEFLLKNVSPIHKSEIDEVISNYISSQNDLMRKNVSNDEYVKSENKKMKKTLVQFMKSESNIISEELKIKIINKIEELE